MAAGESKDKPAAAKAGEAETKTETKADAPPAPTSLTDGALRCLRSAALTRSGADDTPLTLSS